MLSFTEGSDWRQVLGGRETTTISTEEDDQADLLQVGVWSESGPSSHIPDNCSIDDTFRVDSSPSIAVVSEFDFMSSISSKCTRA